MCQPSAKKLALFRRIKLHALSYQEAILECAVVWDSSVHTHNPFLAQRGQHV